MQYDNNTNGKFPDRYVFATDDNIPVYVQCCTEYSLAYIPVELAHNITLYVDNERVVNQALMKRLVNLIPQEVYIRDILCGHEIALYIRNQRLRDNV